MTAEEFVKNFYLERQSLIESYFESGSSMEVSSLIKSLDFDDKQTERLRQILGASLRDAFYTVLLGLDGVATIGQSQINYKLLDEENKELTGGELKYLRLIIKYNHLL